MKRIEKLSVQICQIYFPHTHTHIYIKVECEKLMKDEK